jgi:hypothetical protein
MRYICDVQFSSGRLFHRQNENSNVLLRVRSFRKIRVLCSVHDVFIGHVVIVRATKWLNGCVLLDRERTGRNALVRDLRVQCRVARW